jgi:hypothetical protein
MIRRFLTEHWPIILMIGIIVAVLIDGLLFAGSGGNPDCPSMPSRYC